MKVTYAHLCDYASVSREGKLSVNGIFNRMKVTALPHIHPQFFLVYEIEFSRTEIAAPIALRVALSDEDGGLVLKSEGQLEVKAGPKAESGIPITVPQIMGFRNIKFDRLGRYQWSVMLNGREDSALTLNVIKVTPPSPERKS